MEGRLFIEELGFWDHSWVHARSLCLQQPPLVISTFSFSNHIWGYIMTFANYHVMKRELLLFCTCSCLFCFPSLHTNYTSKHGLQIHIAHWYLKLHKYKISLHSNAWVFPIPLIIFLLCRLPSCLNSQFLFWSDLLENKLMAPFFGHILLCFILLSCYRNDCLSLDYMHCKSQIHLMS